jgi:DNA-binding LytR/AlgR family response regulator
MEAALHVMAFDLRPEDCERTAKTLRKYFNAHGPPAEVTEYTSIQPFVLDYMDRYGAGAFCDMAFVGTDSMMGVEAARAVRGIDGELPLFFVSEVSDFALEAHRLLALNYLTKPLLARDVEDSVARITMSCYVGRHRIPKLLCKKTI